MKAFTGLFTETVTGFRHDRFRSNTRPPRPITHGENYTREIEPTAYYSNDHLIELHLAKPLQGHRAHKCVGTVKVSKKTAPWLVDALDKSKAAPHTVLVSA